MVGNNREFPEQWRSLSWARASAVFGRGNFDVFKDIDPNDIRQGENGDCYLLCCLSSLAEQPSLIKRLFDIEHANDQGVYAVWLNINGKWKEIILDDYFPVRVTPKGTKLAMSNTDEDELWVLLLEKAYAKAYGSYDDIQGGDPVYAMRDLTGAPYSRIVLS